MIPLERPAKGCARPVELDLWVNFTENTRDLKGEGLWRVGLYGSSSIDGNGTRYAEVRQSLNALQSAERLSDARPISFSDIVTDFELGSIGCIKEYPYFCVEFAKAEAPTPDYTFITEMGDTSLISCVPQECNAGEFTQSCCRSSMFCVLLSNAYSRSKYKQIKCASSFSHAKSRIINHPSEMFYGRRGGGLGGSEGGTCKFI